MDKLDPKLLLLLVVIAVIVILVAIAPDGQETALTSEARATAAIAGQLPPTPTPTPRQIRNNGSKCDPNSQVDPPPGRNSQVSSNPPKAQVTVTIPKSLYPETAAHIEAAQAAGHPKLLTIDRAGNTGSARRNQAINICPQIGGWERDEYPPALFREGGAGASVRYIEPTDNGGAGARMGNLLRSYPDGTIVEIKVV